MTQDPNMSDSEVEHEHVGELDRIAETFTKVKEFLEASGFTLGSMRTNEVVTPIRKVTLSTWTNYYKSLVMKPGHTIQKLYPALDQCEALDTDTLKTESLILSDSFMVSNSNTIQNFKSSLKDSAPSLRMCC